MNFGVILLTAGLCILVIGTILFFLPRTQLFCWAIEKRRGLIYDFRSTGNDQEAQRLSHEVSVLERRLPVYSKLFLWAGTLLIAISFAVYVFS